MIFSQNTWHQTSLKKIFKAFQLRRLAIIISFYFLLGKENFSHFKFFILGDLTHILLVQIPTDVFLFFIYWDILIKGRFPDFREKQKKQLSKLTQRKYRIIKLTLKSRNDIIIMKAIVLLFFTNAQPIQGPRVICGLLNYFVLRAERVYDKQLWFWGYMGKITASPRFV